MDKKSDSQDINENSSNGSIYNDNNQNIAFGIQNNRDNKETIVDIFRF